VIRSGSRVFLRGELGFSLAWASYRSLIDGISLRLPKLSGYGKLGMGVHYIYLIIIFCYIFHIFRYIYIFYFKHNAQLQRAPSGVH
jgi:hypothetical protein